MSFMQWVILIGSVGGVGLAMQPWRPALEKFAPVVGLLSQPFWLIETFNAQQYGMFFNSILFTFLWGLGIYKYWIKRS